MQITFDPQNPFFPLEGDTRAFRLSAVERAQCALLPFVGKTPPRQSSKKRAIIFWGPPNSGKTTFGDAYFAKHIDPATQASFISVCYDEAVGGRNTGAIFNVPDFAAGYPQLVALQNRVGRPGLAAEQKLRLQRELREESVALFRLNRPDSQNIRSLTLNQAVHDGFNLLIDTTSASPGIYKMVNNLRRLGYDEIEFWGVYAPAAIAEARSAERLRIVEQDELFGKRVGPLEVLPGLLRDNAGIEPVNRFILWTNATDGARPLAAMVTENGAIATAGNAPAYAPQLSAAIMARRTAAFVESVRQDAAYFNGHADPLPRGLAPRLRQAADNIAVAVAAVFAAPVAQRPVDSRHAARPRTPR